MPLREFETCRQRIERARAHSEAFAKIWNDLLEDDAYSASLKIDDDGTGFITFGTGHDALPVELGLELGEFLYHLRAALDACVYAAAVVESGQNPPPDEDRLEFPLCSDPGGEDKFNKSAWKYRPLTNQRRVIIESVQPYKTPELRDDLYILNMNRTLGILNDWARIDRHRKLHVVGSWASRAEPALRLPPGIELEWMMVTYDGFLENDGLIATFKLDGYTIGAKVEANPNVFVDVTVNESPEPCADNDTLSNRTKFMLIYVSEVVRAIEQSLIDEREAGVGIPD